MIYLDTSAAVPLFVPEPASASIDRWFSECDIPLVSSDWIVTEFASALSIKERSGVLSPGAATAAWKQFNAFCAAGLHLAPVSREAFVQAAAMARGADHGLRSSDALHLAVARELGVSAIATLDANMIRNAKRLKMKTVDFA